MQESQVNALFDASSAQALLLNKCPGKCGSCLSIHNPDLDQLHEQTVVVDVEKVVQGRIQVIYSSTRCFKFYRP